MPIDDLTAEQYVVDASVAIKWFVDEEKSEIARNLLRNAELETIRLFTPDILLYEIGNALGKGKHFGRQDIVDALDVLLDSSVEVRNLDRSLIAQSASFMERYGLTFYDASYAALAHTLSIPLISENLKDQGKVKEIEVKSLASLKNL
jgi:predicted nucleic acid-binding protein